MRDERGRVRKAVWGTYSWYSLHGAMEDNHESINKAKMKERREKG